MSSWSRGRVTERRAGSGCARRAISAAVALLVLQARSAPAGGVAADLGARRRVARPRLLAARRGAHRRDAGRPRDPRARQRPDAGPATAPAGAIGGTRSRADRHGPAGALSRSLHREDARRRLRRLLDLDPEDRRRDLVADEAGQLLVQPEGLLPELVERVLLRVAAEADAAAHVVDLGQVLDPQGVDRAEQDEALDGRPRLRPDLGLARLEHLVGDLLEVVGDRAGAVELEELLRIRLVLADAHPAELEDEVGDALLGGRVVGPAEMPLDDLVEVVVEEHADRVGQVLVAEDLVALGVDRLALAVDDVVELDHALADVEVEALDAGLGALDRLAHDAGLDVVLLVEPEALHHRGDPLRREALHEVVVEREVEARRSRVALAARAAAELVVDAPALVPLR